jgi:predicted amidophosphoribosyltransferase
MANWTAYGDWMRFAYLDGSGPSLKASFTAAYKITDEPDTWSNRFVKFKAKDEASIKRAIALMKFAVPPLLKRLDVDSSKTIFLPALSSAETKASSSGALARLAAECANCSKAAWSYHALTKNAHRPLHTLKTAAARSAELVLADYKAHKVTGSYNHFFIIDDFITRGETLSCAAAAIVKLQANAIVYGLALGKTERKSYNSAVSNDHVPGSFSDAWKSV